MMHRNLDRRVEALVSLTNIVHKKQLISLIDNMTKCASWYFEPSGKWTQHRYLKNKKPIFDIQEKLILTHEGPNKAKLSNISAK
jgi:polyphosphate kinase